MTQPDQSVVVKQSTNRLYHAGLQGACSHLSLWEVVKPQSDWTLADIEPLEREAEPGAERGCFALAFVPGRVSTAIGPRPGDIHYPLSQDPWPDPSPSPVPPSSDLCLTAVKDESTCRSLLRNPHGS